MKKALNKRSVPFYIVDEFDLKNGNNGIAKKQQLFEKRNDAVSFAELHHILCYFK